MTGQGMNPFPHLKYGATDLRVAVMLEPWEIACLLDGLTGADKHPEVNSLRERLTKLVEGYSQDDFDYPRLEWKVAHEIDRQTGEDEGRAD
jgi:hypothetical protein